MNTSFGCSSLDIAGCFGKVGSLFVGDWRESTRRVRCKVYSSGKESTLLYRRSKEGEVGNERKNIEPDRNLSAKWGALARPGSRYPAKTAKRLLIDSEKVCCTNYCNQLNRPRISSMRDILPQTSGGLRKVGNLGIREVASSDLRLDLDSRIGRDEVVG